MTFVTKNCSQYRHPEFVLECDEPASFDVLYLAQWLENLVSTGSILRAGQTLQVGWAINKIEPADDGMLTLWEPDFSGTPGKFVHSVTQTLLWLRKHKGVVESFAPEQKLLFPSLKQGAIKCSRFDESEGSLLIRTPATVFDSGWFFGCRDDHHDHSAAENLVLESLYSLACRKPAVIEFLAMPEGSLLTLDGEGHLVSAFDGEDRPLTVKGGSYLEIKKVS